MPSAFDLIVTADYPNRTAEFRLLDADGNQLASRRTDFGSITVSRQQGLFDLRNYLWYLVEPGREAETVAEVGVCIAEEVLGEDIFLRLWESRSQRTLRIQLPGATVDENPLAAALARVPWEIARPAPHHPTLGDRNLLVRVVHDAAPAATQPLDLGRDESLRVLFVFAEARGLSPLAALRERRELHRLLVRRVYPRRRVVADFLTHGVTRERLEETIAGRGGYHVVHWSGHGHRNLLELARPGGARDTLSGGELLDLFARAGGFIPRLVFLSACHSGDILHVADWGEFFAVARGTRTGRRNAGARGARDIPIEEQPGYTGTAHALLQGGVPTVVAMRYEVGDEYARELAVEFYDALLAHEQPKSAAAALMMARRSLLDPRKHTLARYEACDHATPVLYGEEQPGLTLPPGRSPALDTRDRRLHRIAELSMAGHGHFVGRTWELAALGADFIGAVPGAQTTPVALVTGLGGMGKTALAAEALGLWESQFQWVLLYQAKPGALDLEATLRDVHMKLSGELGRYREHVASHPADAVYRPVDDGFAGPERLDRLARNLVRALRDEAILLVLDNFENNLQPQAEPGSNDGAGTPLWACQDPAWDRCLALLAAELPGTPSRVLVTCRHALAVLAGGAAHRVRLGPLPAGEAALYLREHPGLSGMILGGDKGEAALARRLLAASRFHPLLMDRLARLATGDAALRPQLMEALQALEGSHDFAELPALFATSRGDAKELAYLDNALATSLDHLIRDASPDARRLLWVIAIANDPVTPGLLESVWKSGSPPPEPQASPRDRPPELSARSDSVSHPTRPDPAPLLRYLVAVGLVTEERTGPADDDPDLTTHELVRARVDAWIHGHPEDQGDLTENGIRLAFADRLAAEFVSLQHRDMAAAVQAGSRALVYCIQAGDYDRLGGFASELISGSSDPRVVEALIPHLEIAAASAPPGGAEASCLTLCADALRVTGDPQRSLSLYERSARLLRAYAAEGDDEERRLAWSAYASNAHNWAGALGETGDLDAARQRYVDSMEAAATAGNLTLQALSAGLEALRIDIVQGRHEAALPQVEARLTRLEAWWRQHRSGEIPAEAPSLELLARVFGAGLEIAAKACFARKDWPAALRRIDAILEVKQTLGRSVENVAPNRMDRAVVLGQLGRFGEAVAELQACLEVFRGDPRRTGQALSSLAVLFASQGDVSQAIAQERRALAVNEQLADPVQRASSHNNLAAYLLLSEVPAGHAEMELHLLAGLAYRLASELNQDLQDSVRHYMIRFLDAYAGRTSLAIPRVAELLAHPAFQSFGAWVRQHEVDVTDLQGRVDALLEQARQAALADDDETTVPGPPGRLERGLAWVRRALGG